MPCITDYDYELPERYIARYPEENRASSKLMLVDRKTHNISHYHFYDIVNFLKSGDVLILNKTKVIPARLLGNKKPGGHKAEVFLLEEKEKDVWIALVKPGKKIQKGDEIVFDPKNFECKVIDYGEKGERFVKFFYNGNFLGNLEKYGYTPLPPYILSARKHDKNAVSDKTPPEEVSDRKNYQTVFAEIPGSVAAPTAGLHFTNEIIDKLKTNGVEVCKVTLHVGAGTFLPIKSDNLSEHKMHKEFYNIDDEAAKIINDAVDKKKRIVTVGTTSTRTIESAALKIGLPLKSCTGETDLFIYPGFDFKLTQAMITNFHLPRSTLLILISAFADRNLIMRAYREAIESEYRFYSYGDAMMII